MTFFPPDWLISALISPVADFIKQVFSRLGRKLKSNKLINRILGYFKGLKEYSKSYWGKNKQTKIIYYLKVSHNEDGWRREVQTEYNDYIDKSIYVYDTELEAINQAKKCLGGFNVVSQEDRYTRFSDVHAIYKITKSEPIKVDF